MKLVLDKHLPPRTGWAGLVPRGQRLRIVEVDGGQIGDFVVFNAGNLQERFDQARTKANQGRILITKGHVLYSKGNEVMMTITEDTYGIHDLQYGMCSRWIFQSGKYRGFTGGFQPGAGQGTPEFGCWEILTEALKPWNIPAEDIPSPFNVFQTMQIDAETGKLGILPGRSKPGDYIEFRAEMNCLCALSACPCGGKPSRVQVFAE
ncbi:MAG: DUF1989 domain-containing protein [Candidatus Methylomirabilia bacterium]